MAILHWYREDALNEASKERLLKRLQHEKRIHGLKELRTEWCYNIGLQQDQLNAQDIAILRWLLSETFETHKMSTIHNKSFLVPQNEHQIIIEIGPRLSFTTPWSTNVETICHNCGLTKVQRVERSIRFLLIPESGKLFSESEVDAFIDAVHDRMTECRYLHPLESFGSDAQSQLVREIPLLEQGKAALEDINKEMGLAFDDQDIELYMKMFKDMGRIPTTVELFDLSQSNSEHSRHWFFRGRLVIDGKEAPNSLMQIVKSTLKPSSNSVLAFCDNSSAIKGFPVRTILPARPGEPSPFIEVQNKQKKEIIWDTKSDTVDELVYDIIFTAETHNFPTGVAPRPGAETGTGGRIRDVHATGRGALVVAGTAAYCVGNLQIPNYHLPWENTSYEYPYNVAKPLHIEIEASNGASDYGNKFGEPVIQGFTRSFGMTLPNGERREWIKPIMFTGGVGLMDHSHATKKEPEVGMLVVKIGGPAYRIGMGGGAASSLMHGENKAKLDFNAVQRGDAEMEQKLNRAIKACVELGSRNPIVSIHDQGAGGSGNVLKEIVDPKGARIEVRKMIVGDETLSVLEIWGAEYQENDALLIRPEHRDLFQSICNRERIPVAFVGVVTGDGKVVLYDELDKSTPVNLELEKVLGKMPDKIFKSEHIPKQLAPLSLPTDLTVQSALDRVLKLVSVGSKLFLTNKVDRSVTGLIAQQQCVGPVQLPLSNCAVIAQSHFGTTGAAISIGEQPIKGLINCAAMARMTVGEMLTNIVWADITSIDDIKCSGNWMWAAKLPGEGAEMHDTAVAMRDIMLALGVAIDGGKDSLSMAAKVNSERSDSPLVKAPGTLVLSAYVTCPDITKTVTPDIKFSGQQSKLIFIDLANRKNRMGGSSLAQVFQQLGNESPDVDDIELLKRTFQTIQTCVKNRWIPSGHDRSDGGLVTTLLEMAFSGNCGIEITIEREWLMNCNVIEFLFSEELGMVIELDPDHEENVIQLLKEKSIPHYFIGHTKTEKNILISTISSSGSRDVILLEDMLVLRDIWNETSYQLELLQTNPSCVIQEKSTLKTRKGMQFQWHFQVPKFIDDIPRLHHERFKVAVLREEGSNGDREMASAFYCAGFEVWDVTMSDLLSKKVHLSQFNGIAFVGGFSYADVLDSAKGWAGVIKFHKELWNQFEEFYYRKDTFSLGVCNGCQLMALLGWVPYRGIADEEQPRFIHNTSGRFESRFSSVKILPSSAIMFRGMENSVLGVWVAHGEGLSYFPNKKMIQEVTSNGENLAPLRYVDDESQITEVYPYNPNGSPLGIAGLSSKDGRHLAVMPHPERSVFNWQWGYLPNSNGAIKSQLSPWIKMFTNAYEFCLEQQNR